MYIYIYIYIIYLFIYLLIDSYIHRRLLPRRAAPPLPLPRRGGAPPAAPLRGPERDARRPLRGYYCLVIIYGYITLDYIVLRYHYNAS